MATFQTVPSMQTDNQDRAGRDSTVGLTVLALLLALTLGFSAADIQHRQNVQAETSMSGEMTRPMLDGRGKWGGYL